MTRKTRRLTFIGLGMLVLGAATALVLTALSDQLVYFYSPTDIATRSDLPRQRTIRIGGLVEKGSVHKADGLTVSFKVTDMSHTVPVTYRGVLPDLFREGQGIVAEGVLNGDGVFTAREVLAKHDENYMPKEVADALKKAGVWRHAEEGKTAR